MPEINNMTKIILPHKFVPRDYQVPLYNAFDTANPKSAYSKGCRNFVVVWHRRCGKDKTCIVLMVNMAMQRVGAYYYYFPTLALGRKILWEGMDKDGFRFLDHIPKEYIVKKNDHEMKIKLVNGSLIQICGTDRLDVVGTNPVGAVFSEFAQQNPEASDYISPIFLENDGWALYQGTPRGKNHFHNLYQMAMENDRWFCEKLTIDDTGIITEAQIEEERKKGKTEEFLQQEYWCSFEFGLEGSYFAQLMAEASSSGRIGDIPHEKDIGVSTAWDIGVSDSNAIWFYQDVGNWRHMIDYYEMKNVGIDSLATTMKMKTVELGYKYNRHFAPHDIKVRDWSAPEVRPRKDIARRLGIDFVNVPKVRFKQDSIDEARVMLPKCRFDKARCKHGIDALQNYQKKWDPKYQIFADTPLHNWASNGADAFQTFAMAEKIHGGSDAGMTAGEAQAMYERYAPPY